MKAEVIEALVASHEKSIKKLEQKNKGLEYDLKVVTTSVKARQEEHSEKMEGLKKEMEKLHSAYTVDITQLNERQRGLFENVLINRKAIEILKEEIEELQTEEA